MRSNLQKCIFFTAPDLQEKATLQVSDVAKSTIVSN